MTSELDVSAMATELDRLRKSNARLLEALKAASLRASFDECSEIRDMAESAIRAAEGEK